MASADFMNRNLSKRVELLSPVVDKEARKRLHHILETHFADTARGRTLKADGTWHLPHVAAAKSRRSQEQFAKEMINRARQANESPDVLVPHTPK